MRAALSMMLLLAVLAFLPLSMAVPGPAISGVSVSRPAFNSVTGQDTISYSLSGPANGSVTVVIVDLRGLVDRAIPGGSAPGRNSATWNGKYGNGSPVPEGRYTAWILFIPTGGPAFTQGRRFTLPAGMANASAAMTVDNTPPNSRVTIPEERGADGNYTEDVHASLNATDSLSGINVTEYRLDGAQWSRYGGAIVIGEGSHTLQYRSSDRAGNIETTRSVRVNVSLPVSRPMVISTVPGDIAGDVPVESIISAWFDRDMDSGSINNNTFLLRDDQGDYVSGTVDYGTAAVFLPTQPLEPLTQYTAVIRNVIDEDGNEISGDYEWIFYTGAIMDDSVEDDLWDYEPAPEDDIPDLQNITDDNGTDMDNISDSGQFTGPTDGPLDNISGGVDDIPVVTPEAQRNLPVIVPDLNSLSSIFYVAGGFMFMAFVVAGYIGLNKKLGKK